MLWLIEDVMFLKAGVVNTSELNAFCTKIRDSQIREQFCLTQAPPATGLYGYSPPITITYSPYQICINVDGQ